MRVMRKVIVCVLILVILCCMQSVWAADNNPASPGTQPGIIIRSKEKVEIYPAGILSGYSGISDSSGFQDGTENGLAIPSTAILLPAGSEPAPVQENRDSNNPMSLTLTVSRIPLVNDETTLNCEVSSAEDAPQTQVTISLPPGAELVGGTLQGTWDLRNDTTVKFSAVVKFTKPGDYRIIATARARPEVDHTWGASNALYLTIGTDKSGYTPPPVYVEQSAPDLAVPLTSAPMSGIPKISIAELNTQVSRVTPRSVDENGNQNPASSPASGTVTLHGYWVYNTKVMDGKLADYRDNEDTIMPLKYALVTIHDYDTGQYLGEGYTSANGEYQITVQNPYPHRIVAYVFAFVKYGAPMYELRVVSQGSTLNGLTDVWALQSGTIMPPSVTGTVEVGTLRPWPGSDSLHAFWLFQDLIIASQYVPVDLKSSTIKWSPTQLPADGAWYDFGSQIILGGLEYTSGDTSVHEIGHNYVWNYKGSWVNDCPNPHYLQRAHTVRCGYSEGWPDYFSLAVWGNPVYTWESGGTLDLDTPTWGTSNWPNGDACEGRVAGALWDMLDTQNDGTDVYSWPSLAIDNTMRTNTGWLFTDYWSTWKSNGNSQNAAFSIYQNTINYGFPTVPAPVISSISPDSAFSNNPGLTITVDGSEFYPTSRVRWNGLERTTTYVSPTRLTAVIPVSDLALMGSYPITVFTPAPGGGTSNSIPFSVKGVIHVISPNGGESWEGGTTHAVTWTQSGLSGTNVRITLYRKIMSAWFPAGTITGSVPATAGSYSWTIASDEAGGTYSVSIESLADDSIYDTSDNAFTIIAHRSISVTVPNGGESWPAGTSHAITWTQTGLAGTNVRIDLWKEWPTGIYQRAIAASVPASDGTFTWSIPADVSPSSHYWVNISSLSSPVVYDYTDGWLTITAAPHPLVSVKKYISNNNASWEDTSIDVIQGTRVYYNVTVKNTGNCVLSSVSFVDGSSYATYSMLQPGASWILYYSAIAGASDHTNTVTVGATSPWGNAPTATDSATYHIIKPAVMIQPTLTEIGQKSTKTVNIVMDKAPTGLSGYKLTITPTNPQVTEVLSVTFPAWAGKHSNSTLPGDIFWVKSVDDSDLVKPGARGVLLGSLTVRGDQCGTTVLNIGADQVDDDFGNPISPSTVSGTIRIVPIVVPLPGYASLPTDPDGDGIYEDLNGNGRLDFADVVLYFNQMEWIAIYEPVCAFDLNGNGRIDFADIVKLFGEI